MSKKIDKKKEETEQDILDKKMIAEFLSKNEPSVKFDDEKMPSISYKRLPLSAEY